MLTRLNLDLDSALIHLPLPALCIRLPKQHNSLAFQWRDQSFEIRSILLSEINEGLGLSLLIDDCVRLCCSLCLLENDPSVIEPDVLSKDREKFEASGDAKYVDKAHRRGKIGLERRSAH